MNVSKVECVVADANSGRDSGRRCSRKVEYSCCSVSSRYVHVEAHSHMVEMMKAASFAVIIAIGVEDNEADEEGEARGSCA
jgi:hypothetical protein